MRHPIVALSSLALLAAYAAPAAAQCDAYVFQPTLQTTGADPRGVAFGRIDGDAFVDMVVPEYASGDVKVLFGTATGGFTAPIAVAGGVRPRAAELGDLDGDGDLDLAVCNEGVLTGGGWQSFGFTVLWNVGGSFTSSTFVALPAGEILPSDLALGDFDGDSDLDVALTLKGTGMNHSKLAAFANLGAQSFGPASLAASGYDPVALALGDVNGDGVLDAVTVNNYAGTVTILNGSGSGTFALVWGHSVGTYPGDLTLGDFDGDGDLDCSVSYRYGVNVLDNVAGVFNWTAVLSAGLYPYAVASGDFDGDGDLDLVSVDGPTDTLYLFDGNGAGVFTPRTSIVVGDNPSWIVPYDVDADGALDLGVVAYLDDGVVILDNDCPLSTYCVGKQNSK
ncbi:MAG: VCBS repeat-containing protein, partial [Planctomycetes bacterium]|nr:VCBS repeat-containing protein [Planctomycetota bacterium]